MTLNTERGVTFPSGFKAAGARCGLKSKNDDLALIVSDVPATVAGVFTTNLVAASSVPYSKRVVTSGVARAIFCKAGNANACTGPEGERHTGQCAEAVATLLGLQNDEILVAATGVIGKPLDIDKVLNGLPALADRLGSGAQADTKVSRAILTTDTRPKQVAAEVTSPYWAGSLRIGGICKGSGMIAPNMATTLCFMTTDAAIPAPLLRLAFGEAMDKSFNRITVDGDTSTNDMALILASGAGSVVIEEVGPAFCAFQEALNAVCLYLAKEVVRDGEGATKLVEISVSGTASEEDAVKIAKTVAESPLVKTALFGCDPNWGRIVAAAGRAGVAFDPSHLLVRLGDIEIFSEGRGQRFDKKAAHEYLKNSEVVIQLQLDQGPGEAKVWTCDYSYDYIRINAEYHT